MTSPPGPGSSRGRGAGRAPSGPHGLGSRPRSDREEFPWEAQGQGSASSPLSLFRVHRAPAPSPTYYQKPCSQSVWITELIEIPNSLIEGIGIPWDVGGLGLSPPGRAPGPQAG